MAGMKTIQTRLGPKNINMVDWNGSEIPETVYKYRDWNNEYHKRVLLNQEIYFSSPKSFNDPYDCRIHVDHSVLKTDPNLCKQYFKDVVDRHKPQFSNEEKEAEVNRLIEEGRFLDDEFIRKCDVDSIENLHKRIGVFSVTAVRDNTLMWAHYANSHFGFCVGFKSQNLFSEIGEDELAEGRDVMYKVDYPQILPTESFDEQWVRQIYTKADFWDYEIEYRLAKFQTNYSFQVRLETITEIIFGYKMNQNDRDLIMCLRKERFPHAKLFEVVPQWKGFEIKIVEIN